MNTRLKEIEAELRRFYDTDNDAPRLIREMMSRFPYPRKEGGGDDDLVTESERRRYENRIADLEDEISGLDDTISQLRNEITDLNCGVAKPEVETLNP